MLTTLVKNLIIKITFNFDLLHDVLHLLHDALRAEPDLPLGPLGPGLWGAWRRENKYNTMGLSIV